jgi:hypothetical protein
MCIHWVISSSCPPLPPCPPFLPQFQAGPFLPVWLILVKNRDKHNKEDKVFLLVKDSYPEIFLASLSCTCVMTHVDSPLTEFYPGFRSPSHDRLCCFKTSVLAPQVKFLMKIYRCACKMWIQALRLLPCGDGHLVTLTAGSILKARSIITSLSSDHRGAVRFLKTRNFFQMKF